MNATVAYGRLRDLSFKELRDFGLDEESARRAATIFAIENTKIVMADKTKYYKVSDNWRKVPKEYRISKGRSELTLGLTDACHYWVKVPGDDRWFLTMFEEFQDYSGTGTFSFCGSDEPIWPKDSDRNEGFTVQAVDKRPILRHQDG